MGLKLILSLCAVFFLLVLISFYFFPLNTLYFAKYDNSNFSISPTNEGMQFYPNMRFPEPTISYIITNCSLQKQNDMQYAFEIMGNISSLKFYPVNDNAEISVTCEDRARTKGDLFIAGEGGPTNVTSIGNIAVIRNGEILLIRESKCQKPNIALHELLHVLGFKHSTNPGNNMYNVTNCNQEIGDDTLQLIRDVYAIPDLPDLMFTNVSANINGRFLNLNMTIINAGIGLANSFSVKVYADNSTVKNLDMGSINAGYGMFVSMNNIWIPQISVKELEIVIESNSDELNKENNKIKLELQKN
jgi:hypothetical protein